LSFIPIGNEYIYYDFMVDNDVQSKYNYHKWLAEGKLPNGKNLFITEYDKYTFK
jgi:GH25 family lysozyme M1 (1,4-beta-N-acetylmuramidase)